MGKVIDLNDYNQKKVLKDLRQKLENCRPDRILEVLGYDFDVFLPIDRNPPDWWNK